MRLDLISFKQQFFFPKIFITHAFFSLNDELKAPLQIIFLTLLAVT